MAQFAQFRGLRFIVRVGEGKYRRMARQERTQRRRLRGRKRHTSEDGIQKIVKERRLNGTE
jgi:hypothetical protein